MNDGGKRLAAAVEQELRQVAKAEAKQKNAALRARPAGWKAALEKKIPEKAYHGLEGAFAKAFSTVFSQGRGLLEKSYDKEALRQDHAVQDFAVRTRGTRRELRRLNQSAGRARLLGVAVTAAEGVGLGALGVGLPDIVLFIGTLLRGVYEMALRYGFGYESPAEQLLILKMLATALSSGDEWVLRDAEVDQLLTLPEREIAAEALDAQMQQTASAFAMDMLLLKFVQGIPVVGIVGGAANPVYYQKIMRYVQLKYRKRYLLRRRKEI